MHHQPIRFYDLRPKLARLEDEVIQGLSRSQKAIPPKYFYDKAGSELFDAITELPEYYLTRTEIAILQRHREEMAEFLGHNGLLVELGSGSSTKTHILLDALQPAAYVPIDISREHLREASLRLARRHPQVQVHATCADYSAEFELPYCPQHLPRAAFFPGSSVGNFEPAQALGLLARVADMVDGQGRLLIGVDLKKDPGTLNTAYNDAHEVTAAFNLNLLERLNRELAADFDLGAFDHRAFYNEREGRVEMHLVSKQTQQVSVAGHRFAFDQGESIHTENSYKYSLEEFSELAAEAGFRAEKVWMDDQKLFSVHGLCRIEN